VDKKGALTGGYLDLRASRMKNVRNFNYWLKQKTDAQKQLEKVKIQIIVTDQEITKLRDQILQADSQKSTLRLNIQSGNTQIDSMAKELGRLAGNAMNTVKRFMIH
jgi:chromosome segregation ATPase